MVTAEAAAADPCTPAPNTIIAKAAPKADPCETPSVEEDARGFLKTLCITAPAIARADPIIVAVRALGNLIPQIIRSNFDDSLLMSD